tara:strand:- start:225 stop:365 length:141 start_codon:yes stop_codon:yes gene_type:complete
MKIYKTDNSKKGYVIVFEDKKTNFSKTKKNRLIKMKNPLTEKWKTQ